MHCFCGFRTQVLQIVRPLLCHLSRNCCPEGKTKLKPESGMMTGETQTGVLLHDSQVCYYASHITKWGYTLGPI